MAKLLILQLLFLITITLVICAPQNYGDSHNDYVADDNQQIININNPNPSDMTELQFFNINISDLREQQLNLMNKRRQIGQQQQSDSHITNQNSQIRLQPQHIRLPQYYPAPPPVPQQQRETTTTPTYYDQPAPYRQSDNGHNRNYTTPGKS